MYCNLSVPPEQLTENHWFVGCDIQEPVNFVLEKRSIKDYYPDESMATEFEYSRSDNSILFTKKLISTNERIQLWRNPLGDLIIS